MYQYLKLCLISGKKSGDAVVSPRSKIYYEIYVFTFVSILLKFAHIQEVQY